MQLPTFLKIFYETHEAEFDDRYEGDSDALVEAFGFIDGDFEPEALSAGFEEAGISESEEWPEIFWANLSSALEEADV